MPHYALARHVFVCMQGEHVVFLDVRKDRYFALESARTAGLGDIVSGWPVRSPDAVAYVRQDGTASAVAPPVQADGGTLTAVVALLLEKEILTPDTSAGKAVVAPDAQAPRTDLTAEAIDDPPRVGFVVILRFIAAAVRAALLLKYRTFESVVYRVADRNRVSRDRKADVDLASLHQLVAVFATLRPFFFTAKDACLFDALALAEFLAGYGIDCRWVFGVQARPFAAHCWLQHDGIVLNDTVDHVRRYTPIMIV
jgi:hypothetical protein